MNYPLNGDEVTDFEILQMYRHKQMRMFAGYEQEKEHLFILLHHGPFSTSWLWRPYFNLTRSYDLGVRIRESDARIRMGNMFQLADDLKNPGRLDDLLQRLFIQPWHMHLDERNRDEEEFKAEIGYFDQLFEDYGFAS